MKVNINKLLAPPSKEVDAVESRSSSSEEVGYDVKETKKLLRKIDWTLLPFLALLYLLSFLDRSERDEISDTERNVH